MNTHKDLIVWQKAMELVLEVYKATRYIHGRNYSD